MIFEKKFSLDFFPFFWLVIVHSFIALEHMDKFCIKEVFYVDPFCIWVQGSQP